MDQSEAEFNRPGRPIDNAKIESFKGRLREACLNGHWFRRKIEAWRAFYNEARPHTALSWLTPSEIARKTVEMEQNEVGNFQV